jgi:RNA polymerase sigma factor (sigma-70 family)
MPEEAFGDLQGPAFTEWGQHAREVANWALPPEETWLRREALATLRQIIARLPALYRTVCISAEIEGLSHQEIASILELTVATAKTRLQRARLYLREVLAEYWVERRRTSA